jgi:membrane-bound lytic murein transglycosylase F
MLPIQLCKNLRKLFSWKPHFFSLFFLFLLLLNFSTEVLGFQHTNSPSYKASPPSAAADTVSPDTAVRSPFKVKKLVVLLDGSLYNYSLRKGAPVGLEYDLLNLFAKEHGLSLEVKVISEVAHLLDSLQAGHGDMAAANFNITSDTLPGVQFTESIFEAKHRLIHRKDQARSTWAKLAQQATVPVVMVRKYSTYSRSLADYINEKGLDVRIEEAPEHATDEELIEMVSEGLIDYTVTDGNIAKTLAAYYTNIDYETTLTEKLPIGWAVNRQSVDLLNTLNRWITKRKSSSAYAYTVRKYTETSAGQKEAFRKNYSLVKAGKISQYDQLIRKHAAVIGWDWELLAALVYQESRFNPRARSSAGAVGLMQLMPRTAVGFGASHRQLTSPEHNIRAGIRYLEWLEENWKLIITDDSERLRFVLASYNVGLGHVMDARRLAKKHGYQPDVWQGNVELMLLRKSQPSYYRDKVVKHGPCRGSEPVNYVKNTLQYYKHYKHFARQAGSGVSL